MASALLFQPRPRWRFGIALGAAILIHCGAIGLASIHKDNQIDSVGGLEGPDYTPVIIDIEHPPENSTPPPEPIETPPPVVPNEDSFPEEHPTTPPPVQRHPSRTVTSIQKNQTGIQGSTNFVHRESPRGPRSAPGVSVRSSTSEGNWRRRSCYDNQSNQRNSDRRGNVAKHWQSFSG